MEIWNNYLVQLGAVGLMIAGLIIFSRYLFNYMMQQVKHNESRNNELERQFREYLIKTAKEHHEIILKNTEAFERLVTVLSRLNKD